MSFNMTAEEAMMALTKAVALKGADFRYTSPLWKDGEYPGSAGDGCLYVHSSPEGPIPGCIAGWALHSHGVSLARLQEWEDTSALSVVQDLSRDGSDSDRNNRAGRVLRAAQSIQDVNGTWGAAWQAAKDRYELGGAVYPYATVGEAIAALPAGPA